MTMNATTRAKDVLNTALRPLNVQVVRGRSDDPAVRTFIPARSTIAAARRSGLSVGDYIDRTFAKPGTTQAAVEAMLRMADLHPPVERVCEIGPGSGRYLEKVAAALHPDVYEVYETAVDWLPHLGSFPNVVVQHADGRTLGETGSGSVDLVHAHKVFVYLEFWTTASYLNEMARVVRPGGTAAFDIVSEPCMDDATVSTWIQHGSIYRPVPRAWTIGYLERRGLTYVGSHSTFLGPGMSELLVFRR